MQILQQIFRLFKCAQCSSQGSYRGATLQLSILWATFLTGAPQEHTWTRAQSERMGHNSGYTWRGI